MRHHIEVPAFEQGKSLLDVKTVEFVAGAGFDVEAVTDLSREVRGTWGICLRRAVGRFFRDSATRSFVFSSASRNRVFPLTMFRIWLAYRTGAMRYLVFRAYRD